VGEVPAPVATTARGGGYGDADLAAGWLVDRFSQAAAGTAAAVAAAADTGGVRMRANFRPPVDRFLTKTVQYLCE